MSWKHHECFPMFSTELGASPNALDAYKHMTGSFMSVPNMQALCIT